MIEPDLIAPGPRSSAASESTDANRSASLPRCFCGAPLPAQRTGRTRSTCSARCRLRRDKLLRKLRRRELWVGMWRALDAGNSCYSTTHVQREIATLMEEIRALNSALRGDEDQP